VKKTANFETVRKIAAELPGVEESTYWGSPALKSGGKMVAVIPTHKSAEPGSVAISVDFDRRAELLEAAPEIYYVKPHYENYPVVLVRLNRVDEESLRDLLKGALRFANASRAKGKRKSS